MNDVLEYINQNIWAANALESLFLIGALLVIRLSLNYSIDKAKIRSRDLKRSWKVHIRNLCIFVLVIGLTLIWSHELKTLALSLVAFGVAIILAIKELITCVTGSILKASAGSFAIGDRIIIGDIRGDVIDQNLLSTTILEVGPGKELHQFTGRAVTIPNSLFLTAPLINESFEQEYVLHSFTIPLKFNQNWREAEKILLELATEACSPFLEDAKAHFAKLAKKKSFDPPAVEPRIAVSITGPEQINMILRIPAPFRRKGRIEQEIIQTFMDRFLAAQSSNGVETAVS